MRLLETVSPAIAHSSIIYILKCPPLFFGYAKPSDIFVGDLMDFDAFQRLVVFNVRI